VKSCRSFWFRARNRHAFGWGLMVWRARDLTYQRMGESGSIGALIEVSSLILRSWNRRCCWTRGTSSLYKHMCGMMLAAACTIGSTSAFHRTSKRRKDQASIEVSIAAKGKIRHSRGDERQKSSSNFFESLTIRFISS